jgi:hypothetical protein
VMSLAELATLQLRRRRSKGGERSSLPRSALMVSQFEFAGSSSLLKNVFEGP